MTTKKDLSAFDPLSTSSGAASRPPNAARHPAATMPPTAASVGGATYSAAPAQTPARPPFPRQLNSQQVQHLEQQGWSSGLIRFFAANMNAFPLRIWVVDNSSFMSVRDSHRISGSFDNIETTNASRWEEAADCIAFHAQLAALYLLPTRFTLVNNPGQEVGPQSIGVGENGAVGIARDIQVLKETMTKVRPFGANPLAQQLLHIQAYVATIASQLRQEGKMVTVVVTTQGLPTDAQGQGGPSVVQDFIQKIRSFHGLPVNFVVRLCTDDENVFDFYNTMDAHMHSPPCDVLDDFFGEALEVYLQNPWLTYALPLHRLREMGFRTEVFDTLDEKALSKSEVRDLCSILFFGTDNAGATLPDPVQDWKSFVEVLSNIMAKEREQWNPVTKRLSPWINLHKLNMIHASSQQPSAAFQHATPNAPQQHFAGEAPSPHHPAYHHHHQQRHQQANFHSHGQQQGQQVPFQQPRQAPSQWQQARPQPSRAQPPSSFPPDGTAKAPELGEKYTRGGESTEAISVLKRNILLHWALQPPNYQALRSIHELLASVQNILPPAFGVSVHSYFNKWKPFSPDALGSGDHSVLKRAMRKTKFFLHPDKLPRDLSSEQALVCKMLWDITADAWEAFGKMA